MATVQLAKPSTATQLARPLKVLVPLMRDAIKAAIEAGKPYFAVVGEMLFEAKENFESASRFYEWAASEFERSQGTLKEWMNYAKEMNGGQVPCFQQDTSGRVAPTTQPAHFPTLSSVQNPNRNPDHKANWRRGVEEVTNRLNVERMSQERQDKEKEVRLQHQLGMQLIDIGYKVLAAKLHPDKGGSQEAMSRLNRVRNLLKGALP